MAYAFYVAVKLLSYIAWCWVALRIWQGASVSLAKAAGFGVLRLAIGIVFGVTIFFVASTGPENVLWKYIAIYTPVRVVEWFILALIIGRRNSNNQTSFNTMLCCLGGIVVSFVADFASPEGVAGHFCVGQCLC
jgi:type IV secretory pathway VirB2 component (pilin)